MICCKRKILMADVDLVWEKNIAGWLTSQLNSKALFSSFLQKRKKV